MVKTDSEGMHSYILVYIIFMSNVKWYQLLKADFDVIYYYSLYFLRLFRARIHAY